MANGFQRFGQGLARTGGGVLAGMAESQDESKQNIKDQQQQDLDNLIKVLQFKERMKPKPEKLKTESELFAELLQEGIETGDFSRYTEAKLAGKAPKDPTQKKLPTNITGAPDVTDIITGRKKSSEKAISEFDKLRNPLISAIKDITLKFPDLSEEDDENLIRLIGGLRKLGERPEEFQVPQGEELSALADSAIVARQSAGVLGGLLGFDPTKKRKKKQTEFDDLFE